MGKTNQKEELFDSTMSLGDHLEELRMRILLALAGLAVGVVVSLFFGKWIIAFIQGPYVDALGKEAHLQTLAPTQGFVSYVKIATISGLILTSPWVFYHLWMFVAAGLYAHERRYVRVSVPFSAALFVAGALFFIFFIAGLSLRFLVAVDRWLGLQPNWTFPMYVSFITSLMLVFGIAFQTPLAIFLLTKTGLVSIEALKRSRKYVVLVIVIVAAMATPPDVYSQIALAIPLYLLYELGILLSYLAGRKKLRQSSVVDS
ncbi:MAG TPA: twin-arginine translocase subunit TatC [Sedimentisphaerales bacterium]|nr:twin-arginine translocase subunit TatC [Sedimentisphaerales bacterium]